MMRTISLVVPLLLMACEDTKLHIAPDPPDLGFVDTGVEKDAGFVETDAGFLDTGVRPAVEPIYIHSGSTLFSYNPENYRAVEVGEFRDSNGAIDGMVDTAIDLDGRMYGGTRDRQIFLIDPETGFCHYLFDFDDILHGLSFLSNGLLVVAGQRVSIIHPNGGNVVQEIIGADQYETSGDIVGLPDGNLYWTVRNHNGTGDGVVRINPNSGTLSWLGEASVDRIYGLGYANGSLYGFSSSGVVVEIDPQSGNVTDQRQLDGTWWGATTNPVRWN